MSNSIIVTVDASAFDALSEDFDKGLKVAMNRLLEKGEQFIRREAPKRTGRLKGERSNGGSVSSDYRKTNNGYAGTINVSAIREAQPSQSAEVVYPSGNTKTVKTRAQKAFDYAEVVATGRPALSAPKRAKAFLVPVIGFSLLKDQTYVVINGQQYLFTNKLRATKPNDYPGRALARLGTDAEAITVQALQQVIGQ